MIDVDDIESELYRVGGYIAGLAGMEKDREKPGLDPAVWFLCVATLAEIVRGAALEAYWEWDEWCAECDADRSAHRIVNEVKSAVLDAISSADADRVSGTGGGS
ncbi:hypothetical protein KDK95_01405 [Actinospica sp. MGRD01-02]|uniref:Uncharacterized protein n=1 Tax=Actinospica acidithermotolerans TaxID=2828514 RepID=A0A941E4E5_9ACTN|nr:hypothetical protein [Actinospica acidithermotolerans]MBR7824946.1 hypothetical protein [Actinospica acidithermotolerans]